MKTRILPVITLYQPWATWIMRGWKDVESRTHNRFACLLGKTVLIHAGQHTDGSDLAAKNPYLTKEQILHNPDEVINGAILGSVFVAKAGKLTGESSHRALIDCENVQRYGLFLESPIKFDEPIPCKGEMGIWYYDLDAKQKVKASERAKQTQIF